MEETYLVSSEDMQELEAKIQELKSHVEECNKHFARVEALLDEIVKNEGEN